MEANRRFSPAERDQLKAQGYVVRERAFGPAEVAAIGDACEAMVRRVSGSERRKLVVGSYMFQMVSDHVTIVKWEPEHPDVVQGIEPFAHFDETLREWAHDARFLEPMRDVVGRDDIELFTEKLNVKRAHTGGPIVLHQDYPYWVDINDHAEDICTAVLFLDDATLENGCLEVVPGSHAGGPRKRRDVPGFGQNEMNPDDPEAAQLVALPVPAGTLVFFGSMLVHRSLHNRSNGDRRTLLFSYQPAGRRKSIDSMRELMRKR